MANHTIGGAAKMYDHFRPTERLVLALEALARGDDAEADRLRRTCPRKTYTGPDAAFDDRFHVAFDIAAIVAGDLRSLSGKIRLLHWAMVTVRQTATLHHINTEMAFLEGIRCGQGLSQSIYFGSEEQPEEGKAQETDPNTGESAEEAKDQGPATYQQEDLSCLGEDYVDRMTAVENRAEKSTELILKALGYAGVDLAKELKSVWEAFGQFSSTKLGLPREQMLAAIGYPVNAELGDALKVYAQVKADPELGTQYHMAMCRVWDRWFGDK